MKALLLALTLPVLALIKEPAVTKVVRTLRVTSTMALAKLGVREISFHDNTRAT